MVLLRSHYCPFCRELVQLLRDEYQSFASQSTAVVPVLPDQVERGAVWQRRYELPFPILADPADSEDDEPSFEAFESYQRLLRALPGAVLFRPHDGKLEFVTTFSGDSPQAFPPIGEILEVIEDHTGSASPPEPSSRADS